MAEPRHAVRDLGGSGVINQWPNVWASMTEVPNREDRFPTVELYLEVDGFVVRTFHPKWLLDEPDVNMHKILFERAIKIVEDVL